MSRRALLAVPALLGACTLNPVSGRPELTIMSAAEERRIGAEQAAEVARTIGLVDDPKLGTYVQEVGQRLAARSPRRDVADTGAGGDDGAGGGAPDARRLRADRRLGRRLPRASRRPPGRPLRARRCLR